MLLQQRVVVPSSAAAQKTQQVSLRGQSLRPFQPARQHAAQKRGTYSIVRAQAEDDRVPKWEYVWRYLKREKNLESISPSKAKELVDSGKYTIVDVRPKNLYNDATPIGAKSAPLFQLADWSKPSFTKALRAVALMANGVTPVEPNPDFIEDVKKAAGGKGVILACEGGGSTEPTPSFQWGKASRSLTAAYRVLKTGAADPVLHLSGGIFGYFRQFGQEGFTGEYDEGNIGRTPSAAGLEDKQ